MGKGIIRGELRFYCATKGRADCVGCRFNIPYTYNPKWDVNIFDEPVEKPAGFKVKIQ